VSQPLSAPHLIHNPPLAHHAVVAAPHHVGYAGYAGHLGGLGHLGYAGLGLGYAGYAGHGLLGLGHGLGHAIAKRDAAVLDGHTSVSQPLSAPHLIHNPPLAHHAVVAAPHHVGYAGYAGHLGGLGHLGYAGHGLGYAGLGLGHAGLLGYGHLGPLAVEA